MTEKQLRKEITKKFKELEAKIEKEFDIIRQIDLTNLSRDHRRVYLFPEKEWLWFGKKRLGFVSYGGLSDYRFPIYDTWRNEHLIDFLEDVVNYWGALKIEIEKQNFDEKQKEIEENNDLYKRLEKIKI